MGGHRAVSDTIGFDRPVQLDWLDMIASRLASTGDPRTAFDETRAVVSAAVGGGVSPHNAAGKTMTVLARIWLKVPQDAVQLRDAAARTLDRLGPNDRLAIHWAMCQLAYPFFLDAAAIVGRSLSLQEYVTLASIRGRLSEHWGARGTMPVASQRLLKMWDRWGVVRAVDARGTYAAVAPRPIDALTTRTVAELRVRAEATHAVDLDDLQRPSDLFPFVLMDLMPSLHASTAVQINREGGRRWVVRSVA